MRSEVAAWLAPSKLADARAISLVPWRPWRSWLLVAALVGCGSPRGCSHLGGLAGSSSGDKSAGQDDPIASETPGPGERGRPVVPGGVRWVGRVDASHPEAVKFAWSGTGFVATVTGPKIAVKLETDDADTAYFQPVIDGKAGARFKVEKGLLQTVTLADGLSPGDHTVELYRESEGMYGVSLFAGFAEGTLKGAPAPSGRLIEVIGDSISAGYGNLGKEVHPPWDNACGFSLETESAYQAFGPMIGRALDADVSIIARSGWGIYRSGDGNTKNVLPAIYGNTLGTKDTPAWDFKPKADVVILDLGTNDSANGDPGQPYEDAYVAFLRTVRGHYPAAWIFLTIGPMTGDPPLAAMRTHLKHVAATLGDGKVVVVEMPGQDATSTGCDYHPNVATDAKMASVLTKAIHEKIGW